MQNYDQAELDKFKSHAAHWWDENGPLKTLHDINPLRLQFIAQHCSLKSNTAIDIGCGGGILTESLARAGAIATGIDGNEELIQVAKLHLHESALDVDYQYIFSAELAAKKPDAYQHVICMELLEHVPDPEQLVKDCAALCAPGGTLFFSTINRNAKAYAFAIIAAEYVLNMLPRGTHDYRKFIKPSELARWCRQAGLTVKTQMGLGYNPLNKQYHLSDNLAINYMLVAEKT